MSIMKMRGRKGYAQTATSPVGLSQDNGQGGQMNSNRYGESQSGKIS